MIQPSPAGHARWCADPGHTGACVTTPQDTPIGDVWATQTPTGPVVVLDSALTPTMTRPAAVRLRAALDAVLTATDPRTAVA
jgi:hypothetical protein